MIGFDRPFYEVNEDVQSGVIDIVIQILMGELRIPVEVNFTTVGFDALGL